MLPLEANTDNFHSKSWEETKQVAHIKEKKRRKNFTSNRRMAKGQNKIMFESI